tara:strand:+ start:594 stop:737 length:144 start_codon:yes stop_codon:yes gene_type:complete
MLQVVEENEDGIMSLGLVVQDGQPRPIQGMGAKVVLLRQTITENLES